MMPDIAKSKTVGSLNAINDRLAQFGTTQARIVQRTVDDIKAAVTQGDLSETTLDLLGKSLGKFVEQANKLPPVWLKKLATTTSHSGGFAVGKTNWHKGFFNSTKVRTFAENNSAEIEVVGAFANLTQPKTGQQVPSAYAAFLPSADGMIWGVQNSTLTNDTAGVGILRISCVAVSGLDAALMFPLGNFRH